MSQATVNREFRKLVKEARLLSRQMEWAKAASFYEKAIELNTDDAGVYLALGHMYKEQGKLIEADKQYAKAAVINPTESDVYLQIGHLRKIMGELDAAMDNYAKAVELAKETNLKVEKAAYEELMNLYRYNYTLFIWS